MISARPTCPGCCPAAAARSWPDLHRTHPLRSLLAELSRVDWVTRMDIARLTRQDTGRLVAQLTGREPDEELLTAVYRRAEGNPLFVEALVGNGEPGTGLPESLHDLLMAGSKAPMTCNIGRTPDP